MRGAALTNPLWEQIRGRKEAFQGSFAWADESFDISPSGEARTAAGLWVSGDFFPVLGVKPVAGRLFSPNDDRRGCGFAPGAVISYGFWQREFGGDAGVVGRRISVGGNRIEVIGATPASFFGLEVGKTFDIALPICSQSALHGGNGWLDSGTTWWLTVMGRLGPGVSIKRAASIWEAGSKDIFRTTLPADYPADSVKPYLAMKLIAVPAGYGLSHLRELYSKPLALRLAIAGLVLLIACANLANLMLARANARQQEVAMRVVVGASPLRIAQQVTIEGLLLASAGAGAGLLLGRILSRLLIALLTSENDPAMFLELPQDLRIFAFAAVLAILTCVVFSLAPVLSATRTEASDALRSGGRTMTAGRYGPAFRRVLVATQIAISLVLLMGTLLFVQSLRNLRRLDPGFRQRGIVVADIDFSSLRFGTSGTLGCGVSGVRRVRMRQVMNVRHCQL